MLSDGLAAGLADEETEALAEGSAEGLAVEVFAMGCRSCGQAEAPMSNSPEMSVSVVDTSTTSDAGSSSSTTALKKVNRICSGVARARTSRTPF